MTVNTVLNGKPEESLVVNNGIFRRFQLHIMATKRFLLVYQHVESCIPSVCNLLLLRTLHDNVLRGYRPRNSLFLSLSLSRCYYHSSLSPHLPR